jgi:hypothetical protein
MLFLFLFSELTLSTIFTVSTHVLSGVDRLSSLYIVARLETGPVQVKSTPMLYRIAAVVSSQRRIEG